MQKMKKKAKKCNKKKKDAGILPTINEEDHPEEYIHPNY